MNESSPSPSTILTQQKNKINLLHLPPELLLDIFAEYQKLELPICKSLLSYTRAPIFRAVTIKSIKLFNFFIRTVLKDHSVGLLVKKFKVEVKESNEEDELITVYPKQVIEVLKLLTRAKIIEINWEWLAVVFSSRLASSSALPQMESLTLVDPFRSQIEPWEIIHFQGLSGYKNLVFLNLESNITTEVAGELIDLSDTFLAEGWSSNTQEVEVLKKRNQIVKLKRSLMTIGDLKYFSSSFDILTEPKFLTIFLDIQTSSIDPSLAINVSYFIQFASLRISDSLVEKGLVGLLEELPFLAILEIYHDTDRAQRTYPHPLISIYPLITRFDELESFHMSARVFTPELFQYLRDPLPLAQLSFYHDTPVSISDLKQLLLPGPAKLSALKTLTLDNIFALAAEKRVATDGLYYDEEDDEFTFYPDWYLAHWTEEFDEEGLEELVKLGKEQGVEIEGSAIESLGVQDEFDNELDLVNQLVQEMENDSDDWIDDE